MAKGVSTAQRAIDPQDTIGYCAICNALVRRGPKAVCPNGHESKFVQGAQEYPRDKEVPELPVFNFGAFFAPFLWGPAHGSWVAALVLPLLIFVDSALRAAVYGVGEGATLAAYIFYYGGATVVVLFTLALMFWFGRRGWGQAWAFVHRTGISDKTWEQFKRGQFYWAIFSTTLFLATMAGAIYYWINYLPEAL